MKNAAEAAANIKRFALMMQGLLSFAEDLEAVDGLANQVKELEAAKENLLKEVELIDDVKSKSKEAADKKQVEINDKILANEAKASNILSQAKATALAIVEKADIDAQDAKSAADAFVILKKSELEDAKKELVSVNEKVEVQSQKLLELNKAIASIKGA
jgi:hypothetical protein